MKQVLFILVVFISQIGFSQCQISFDEFVNMYLLDENDIETALLKKGFEYDHKDENYRCNYRNIKTQGRDLVIQKQDSEGYLVTVYTFQEVKIFLDFKTKLEKEAEYLRTIDDDDEKTRIYQYKDKQILLMSKTVNFNKQHINIYTITSTPVI